MKVLVVDDNEINGMLVCDLLTEFKIDSDLASSGEKAIDMASNGDYIFILMDYIMPEMNGIEATQIIVKMKPLIRIYAMTGELTSKLLEEFVQAGATGALSKPIQMYELFDIIRDNLSEDEYVIPDALKEQNKGQEDNDTNGNMPRLEDYLAKIPQLDYAIGMSNTMGNREGYKKLLKASAGNIREYRDILSEFSANSDRNQVRISLHSLKSVFANIGLEELKWETARVEQVAKESLADLGGVETPATVENFSRQLAEYMEDLKSIANLLESVLTSFENDVRAIIEDKYNTVAECPLSQEDFEKVLEYTHKALERYEVDYILEGLEHIKKALVGSKRKDLERAIDAANDFEYETIDEILKTISAEDLKA